jgi:hypothetical protein
VKTQIIRIEPHDDAISVKDKMGWSQTPRILLVWPKQSKILNRRLDLVYLVRHSTSLGAQLAFVTKDPNVRYFAKKLNIPVYPNIHKAEESRWRRLRRRKRGIAEIKNDLIPDLDDRPDLEDLRKFAHPKPLSLLVHPFIRLIFFTFGVLGVLAIASILVPSAEIRVSPKTRWEAVTIPASASLQTKSTDLSGTVPAQIISVIIEGRGNIPSTGSITIPDKKSQGKVVFNNLTGKPISIPGRIIVSTEGDDPVRFTTLQTIEVGSNSISELVPVEAIFAGSAGNVLSNHILAIEGPLGLDLTVTNPIGTSHGSDQTSPAPRDKDYQVLSDKLLADLFITAGDELESKLESHDLLLWTDPTEYEILEATFNPAEIQPADLLIMTLRVEYKAYIVTGEELINLGRSVLEANMPESYSPIQSTLVIEHIQPPIPDAEMVFKWDMDVKWQVSSELDEVKAVKWVLWRKPEDATQQLLDNLPINEDISISMSPHWWPRLPILPFRVNVITIQNSSESPG